MKYFLDTEFIEYPYTIDLISIGIVAEDGRELYAVSSEYDESYASDWVKENVIPILGTDKRYTRKEIADQIFNFIKDDKPEFWGYCCVYDWVVFLWLFGSAVDRPSNFPFFCNDIQNLATAQSIWLSQCGNKHNALNDAQWVKNMYENLTK